LRSRAERPRHGWTEAVEAARLRHRRGVPARGLPRACADELPRASRLELRRQDDDHVARRAHRTLYARARPPEPRGIRLSEARLDERRVLARALAGRVRGRARPLDSR